MMTSAAETPSPWWMSTGIPRPSSRTVQEPSAFNCTSTRSAKPPSGSPIGIQMRGNFIEKEQRRNAVMALLLQPGIGEHDGYQQCLLFAGRAIARVRPLQRVPDFKIGKVRPHAGAARIRVALARRS